MGNPLVHAVMAVNRFRYWRPVERMARRPEEAQRRVLLELLSANRETRFGTEHGFAAIRDPAAYRDRVAVHDYEMLRPYIDEQRRTGARALTAESPVFYAQTSGTTGAPKYIPMTRSMLAIHRSDQALFSYLQFRSCPAAFEGKVLGIVGAAVEGRLDSGHAVGSVSGHMYGTFPGQVRSRYVLPPEVSGIEDYGLKYLVMVRLAMAEADVRWMGSPNPSTFLRLLEVMNRNRDLLIDSLRTGKLEAIDALDPAVRDAIARRLTPNRLRADRLSTEETWTYANVWPDLRLVTTWTGGNCGIALASLRARLPAATLVMELGYLSSEFRGTIPLEAEEAGGLPPLHHHFLEFVEQGSWDSGAPEVLTLDRIEPGARYYILVTTASGLYRYFMNDLVEVTGFLHRTPLLRFLQKGKGVTSLTGEKLYETQTIEAVTAMTARFSLASSFFLVVADDQASAYHVFIELEAGQPPDAARVAAALDERLGELNIEYQGKRASGRLGPATVAWLKRGTSEAYKAACVAAGQREGQLKPAVLQYRKDLLMSLDDHMIR